VRYAVVYLNGGAMSSQDDVEPGPRQHGGRRAAARSRAHDDHVAPELHVTVGDDRRERRGGSVLSG
jgi:hypothetical protein